MKEQILCGEVPVPYGPLRYANALEWTELLTGGQV